MGGPWLGGSGGLSLVGSGVVTFYLVVFHVRGVTSPRCGCVFLVLCKSFVVGSVGLLSQKKKKEKKRESCVPFPLSSI